MNQTVLITGAGGYVGSLVTQALAQGTHEESGYSPTRIIALDVRGFPKSLENFPQVSLIKSDIRSPDLFQIFDQFKPDVVAHLASIVTPGKKSDRNFEYSVDVLGTRNVLDACLKSGVKKVIISSSGAAYGYHPDNPIPLKEDHPLRGNQEFAYSDHKRLVEEMLKEYRVNHPELKQLILRLATVIGKTAKNQITALFEKPVVLGISGSESPFSFIWDQDVVNVILRGIATDQSGTFNLVGDGTLSMKEIAKILNKPYISISPPVLKGILHFLKKTGLSHYGPEQIRYLQFRPVMSNENLKNIFRYNPRKTSKEAFLNYLTGISL